MAYNAKNFPLEAYPELVAIWEQVREAFDTGTEDFLYIPIGTYKATFAKRFLFHRVRAAIRAQKENGNDFDFISIQLVETDGSGNYGLKFIDKGIAAVHEGLTLFTKSGAPLNQPNEEAPKDED